MKVKKVWSILMISAILGCFMFFAGNYETVKAAEVVEVEETKLTGNVVYNGATKIAKGIDLNGYVLQVNGDLEIAADITLSRGTLLVNGNILHMSGTVEVGQGIIEVSKSYRIQNKRVLVDGTEEFLDSNGAIRMTESDGLIKIGGDFIIQSSRTGSYYDNHYGAGKIEIEGNLIQKNGNEYNFSCSSEHEVIFRGKNEHKIEFESSKNGFANLESEGEIIWKGYMRINKMASDLTVKSEKKIDLVIGQLDVNEKHLNLIANVKTDGNIDLSGGIMKIEGDLLQMSGNVTIGHGIMEVSGDYRIQNIRNLTDGTIQYIGSNGALRMLEADGLLRVNGNFVTQSLMSRHYSYNWYEAGTMEIGGDVIQKNGDSDNFVCTDNHKVILIGKKGQKIEFESTEFTFNTLVITRPLSEYTFTHNPCWKSLEESAISLSECTIKNISKKAYTGKVIKPTVTITYQDTKLIQDTDYTISYSNNKNTGKATVTITGIGAYTGTVEKTFQIVPAKVTNVKATSTAAKQVTLTWKKDTTATGYILEYTTDKAFKKNISKITINKKATVSREITKLTSKKTYYFRIRAYKTIDGKKAYGAYSSVVSVTIK